MKEKINIYSDIMVLNDLHQDERKNDGELGLIATEIIGSTK